MRKLTCIAIDDEPLALLVISRFCERMGGIELRTFSEPRIGMEAIERARPDLVFLDIEMNSASGLEVARSLPPECCLVFTTAHAQYALSGFELDAADFLHKPFAYERFRQAVEKARRRIDANGSKIPATIVVKREYSSIAIALDDIVCVEALGNYVRIFRTSGDSVLSRTAIKTMEEMLPEGRFLRCHRSFIVPADRVLHFTKHDIAIAGRDMPVPIGKSYADTVLALLGGSGRKP